jgi:hypothetical protein
MSMRVRVHAVCAALLAAGCTVTRTAPPDDGVATGGSGWLSPWRTLMGGFLAPAGAAFGLPARPGTGAFVKLLAPTAVALRGNDLLIVDSGSSRVWRADLALNTLSPVAGAPATPGTAVALGPDLSAWVLDGVSRQVLRFARDGRLLQTFRGGDVARSPVALALADGGATLLVADDSLAQWVEFRPVGAVPVPVRPGLDDAMRVRGVDGIAVVGNDVYVLDRNAAVVHHARRDGQVLGQLGQGELRQPHSLAADRLGRVYVVDAQDRTIKLLQVARPTQVLSASELRVQQIGGIAVDERMLAVSDRLTGQVVIHVVRDPGRP